MNNEGRFHTSTQFFYLKNNAADFLAGICYALGSSGNEKSLAKCHHIWLKTYPSVKRCKKNASPEGCSH